MRIYHWWGQKKWIIKKTPKSKIFLKPILREDINKFEYNFNNLWMITIPSGWTNENCKESNKKFMKKLLINFWCFENIENKNKIKKLITPKKLKAWKKEMIREIIGGN